MALPTKPLENPETPDEVDDNEAEAEAVEGGPDAEDGDQEEGLDEEDDEFEGDEDEDGGPGLAALYQDASQTKIILSFTHITNRIWMRMKMTKTTRLSLLEMRKNTMKRNRRRRNRNSIPPWDQLGMVSRREQCRERPRTLQARPPNKARKGLEMQMIHRTRESRLKSPRLERQSAEYCGIFRLTLVINVATDVLTLPMISSIICTLWNNDFLLPHVAHTRILSPPIRNRLELQIFDLSRLYYQQREVLKGLLRLLFLLFVGLLPGLIQALRERFHVVVRGKWRAGNGAAEGGAQMTGHLVAVCR